MLGIATNSIVLMVWIALTIAIVITSAEEGGNVFRWIWLFVRPSTGLPVLKKFWTDFDEIFGGVGVAREPVG